MNSTTLLGLLLLSIGLVFGCALIVELRASSKNKPLYFQNELSRVITRKRVSFVARFYTAAQQHPVKALAFVETALWLAILLSLADHVLSNKGLTAMFVWYLTIGPHEIGHIICLPFGQFLYIAGGSIWQVLLWVLLGIYTLFVRRQISTALFFWAIAGHSFINLSQYIGDARARQLPLLFGQGAEHHDWYNLLNMLGLLNADKALAALSTLVGIVIILAVVSLGILSAWLLPRTRLGSTRRFSGHPVRAIFGVLVQLRNI